MLADMATPNTTERDRRSPAKHAAILKAATEVFLREGYARASVDVIADAAGVGKQTVYGHFGDKQRLFLAVVDNARANTASGLNPDDPAGVIADTGDPRADLQAAAARLIAGITAPDVAALHRLTIAEMAHHPELMQSWHDDGPTQAVIGAIASYLAACDRRGELTVPDPETPARQFVMLVSVEAQVRSLRGLQPLSKREITGIARDTADLIVRAYQPQPGPDHRAPR